MTAELHQARVQRLLRAIGDASCGLAGVAEIARDPAILDRKHPVVDDEALFDNAADNLATALFTTLNIIGERPFTAPLIAALADYLDRIWATDTAEEAASGSPVVLPNRTQTKDPNMLNPSSFANINTILLALVNAGGVRPEDQPTVTALLDELKADEASYSTSIAALNSTVSDHESRITAIEDGVNGEAAALEPAPPAAAGSTGSNVDTGAGGAGADTPTPPAGDTPAVVETAVGGAGADSTAQTSTQSAATLS